MIDWSSIALDSIDPIFSKWTNVMTVSSNGNVSPTYVSITPSMRVIVVHTINTLLMVDVYNGDSMHRLRFSTYEFIDLDTNMISVVEYDSRQRFDMLSSVITKPMKSEERFTIYNARSDEYISPTIPSFSNNSIKILLQGGFRRDSEWYTVHIEVDYYPVRGGFSISLGNYHSYRAGKLPRYTLLPNGFASITCKPNQVEVYQARTGRVSLPLEKGWGASFIGVNERRMVIAFDDRKVAVFEWSNGLTVNMYDVPFNPKRHYIALDRNNLLTYNGTVINAYDTNGMKKMKSASASRTIPVLYDRTTGLFASNKQGSSAVIMDSLVIPMGIGQIIGARGAPTRWLIAGFDGNRLRVIDVELAHQ